MIYLPMTESRYLEILTLMEDRDLRVKLAPNPTTMGPGYIASMIAKILSTKSTVNDWMEEVERAYTKAQVLVNDLETDLALRTDMELNNLQPGDVDGLDLAGRKALVRQKVEQGYINDVRSVAGPDDPPPGAFQLWNDIRLAQNSEIELKSLLRMLDRRRDELNKLDSGIRLQQKTIDTEITVFKTGGTSPALAKEYEALSSAEPDADDENDEDGNGGDNIPSDDGKEVPQDQQLVV
jgi:hypothetical protein